MFERELYLKWTNYSAHPAPLKAEVDINTTEQNRNFFNASDSLKLASLLSSVELGRIGT